MIRRLFVAFKVVAFAGAALLGVEVAAAMRRTYLPTEPVFVIGGTYGDDDGRPLRFVVLGDSTAAGLGARTPDRSYPVLLAQMLAGDGYRVELTGLGVSGARVADVLAEQVPEAVELRPDLVFVCIGANDATHVTPLSAIRDPMDEVFARLAAAGATVVGSGIPDMRADAFMEPLRTIVGWRGREVTGEIRKAAEANGVPVVALAEGTGPFFADDPEAAYSEDMFHPGPGGYRRWAETIYPVLRDALARLDRRAER